MVETRCGVGESNVVQRDARNRAGARRPFAFSSASLVNFSISLTAPLPFHRMCRSRWAALDQIDNTIAKKVPSLPLKAYVDETFAVLYRTTAKNLKEVSAGTSLPRVKGWRDGFWPLLGSMKLGG